MEGSNLSATMALYIDRAYDIISSFSAAGALNQAAAIWAAARAAVLVPSMQVAVVLCLVMSVMLVVEKLSMALVALYVKVFRRTPEKIHKWEPLTSQDVEAGSAAFPVVLVQIPMFNEREVYQMSIGAVCTLAWPNSRLIVQVLDDSTDLTIRELVQKECEKWERKGRIIHYISRDNRNGYKAGALKEAMELDYVKQCDYVAIFDADHEPPSDFLLRTIPFLIHNPDIALVQARWKFVNANECIMTRIQEMSLNYHFKVEQQSGSTTMSFFGFNGTAGVWRTLAIKEAEGWKDRTTVEDMDLAVRATLQGWKFLYLGDLKVKSELPSTYKAYRYQQHRWACGPANLFKKMVPDILMAEKVSPVKKIFLLYNFFFARRIISHNVTFFFYCILIPVSTFFPEVVIPKWGIFYIPIVITILNSVGTPRSLHLIIIWIFFESVMSLHRCKAVFIGLFDAGRVNEWVVTEKLGNALKTKPVSTATKTLPNKFWQRFHFLELGMGVLLFLSACHNCLFRTDLYFIFIFPLSISFLTMGCGYVGTFVPPAK
ncbi:putative mannan synthase 11 [Canna indica]|uniref:glucomannan 4-beta-mannosyltransferase n=1 Tax=Canna indica TaxID=4628 RepID=A0AAQ3JY93_9LILI|nr:putative mannan synthase 11 [Canna indica]